MKLIALPKHLRLQPRARCVKMRAPLICSIGILAFSALPVRAANVVWDGGDAVNNAGWLNSVNWNPDVAPLAGDVLFFGGVAGLVNTNDFAAGSVFGGFNFSAGAGAFVIGGNAVNLSGNIISSSAATQTFNLDLALQTSATTRVNAGGALVLGDAISGGFGVIKTGTGTLTLTNAGNSFAATVVSGGVLSLGTIGLVSASSNLALGNGEFSIAGGSGGARSVGVGGLTLNVGRDAITVASLVSRAPGATTLFRGTALGTAAPNTAGAANLLFTTAPTAATGATTGANNVFQATGTGTLGTTQAAVLREAIVDVSASGGGSAFATYDPVRGVRGLALAEQAVTYSDRGRGR